DAGASSGVQIAGAFQTAGSVLFQTCTAGTGSGCYAVNLAATCNITGSLTLSNCTTPNSATNGGAVRIGASLTATGNLIATNITTGTGSANIGWTQAGTTTVGGFVQITASSS